MEETFARQKTLGAIPDDSELTPRHAEIPAWDMIAGEMKPVLVLTASSDDQQMLEYAKAASGARLSVAVLHDDAKRKYAYGPAQGLPNTSVGTFSQEMYEMARKQGWIVVSMKDDWNRIFAFE